MEFNSGEHTSFYGDHVPGVKQFKYNGFRVQFSYSTQLRDMIVSVDGIILDKWYHVTEKVDGNIIPGEDADTMDWKLIHQLDTMVTELCERYRGDLAMQLGFAPDTYLNREMKNSAYQEGREHGHKAGWKLAWETVREKLPGFDSIEEFQEWLENDD